MKVNIEKLNLLLVDDEEGFRQTIAKRLTRRGFSTAHVGSGHECLTFLDEHPVDVIVMDVKMPGLSGIETLVELKKKYPTIEVIFLTGHANTTDGVDGIKVGAFDYLSKPVEFEHLISKVKQAYGKILLEEEIQREAKLKARMEKKMVAAERLASLGTLSTGVAHEINNPLAIIKESAGFIRLILNKPEQSGISRKDDLENALDKIENGIERASRITHQLLGFVKKQESVISETNLKNLVDETIELVKKEAKDKEIKIISKMDASSGVIWSDPYQLRQVLLNLLTNAIYATEPGGKVTATIKDMDDDIALLVQDTGEGIPPENLATIFEPFYTTKPTDKGTGLGLYVTRGIITKLGGDVKVTSVMGHGTSFWVTLPKCYENGGTLDENKDICVDILGKIKGENEA